ncbi:type IV secretion system DNA-binding domain-containing protein, partial [Rickettsia endosymbiont of Cardiosporidium cionae]|uniref:type IV secretion system DNA-binding domain-containing protein n=1 Tax=Rickettsia endosymbiont of Cardiosporidium cionae TaxID=2777155 RepID=UPI001893E7BF
EKQRRFYDKATKTLKKERKPELLKQQITSRYTADEILDLKITQKELSSVNDILISSLWRALAVAVMGMLLVTLYLSKRGSKTKNENFIRGRRITDLKNLNKLILKENKRSGIVNPYSIGNVYFAPRAETEHTMIVGVSGSGKTVLLKNLIKQIKEKGDKAIIYDYTGTFVESFYDEKKDIIINPFDRRSKTWNLMKEVSQEAEFDTIAEALIGSGDLINDPFWPNGARLIFAEICKLQYRKGNLKTQDLYKCLQLDVKKLNKVLASTLASNFTNQNSEKTTLSLLMLLATHLKGLQYINNDGITDFSIKDWLLNSDMKNTLFISSRSSLHGSIAPLISAMMDIAINNIGELPLSNNQKTWLIFDEIASLNYLPSLEKGLTVSRNFGGCFVIALQSISQLIHRYSQQVSNTISSNCSNKIILKAGNNETATWVSKLLGTAEAEQYKEGLSYGAHEIRDGVNLSKNRVEREIALPSEILSLAKLRGYALMSGGYPITKIDINNMLGQKLPFKNVGFVEKRESD